MPANAKILTCTVWEESGVLVMARIENWQKILLTAGMVDAIELTAIEIGGEVTLEATELVAADVVLAPVSGDERWPHAEPYNFRHLVAGAFPRGGRRVRLEYWIDFVSGEPGLPVPIDANVLDLLSR